MADRSLYDLEVPTAQGDTTTLASFRNQVLLVVNTASKCVFTPQYSGLEQLQERFSSRGFSVLGFPCNQFGGQEPGTAEEIQSFCTLTYGVKFPVFGKVEVNGPGAHPLFQHLTSAKPGLLGSKIKWNFTKFLVDRNGKVVARFAPQTSPASLEPEIRKLLEK